jgi:hypothetical protein
MLDSAPWSGFLKHSTVGSVEAIDLVQALNAGHVTFAAIARSATNWLQVPLRTIHHWGLFSYYIVSNEVTVVE